jgi:hypothetical protein
VERSVQRERSALSAYTPRPSPERARTLGADELEALRWRWFAEAHRNGDLRRLELALVQFERTLAAEDAKQAAPPATLCRVVDPEVGLELERRWEDGKVWFEARVQGKTVACTRPGGELFVPGPWVDRLREAVAEAWEAEQERHAQAARDPARRREPGPGLDLGR